VTWPLVALFAANLYPLAGVLFLGWSLGAIMILYWLENAVIGLYNVGRMAVVTFGRGVAAGPPAPASRADGGSTPTPALLGIFLIPFFCVHYGMFWAGHGFFVLTFFGQGSELFEGGPPGGSGFLPWGAGGPLEVVPPALAPALGLLLASHGVSFAVNFLGRGEYRAVDLGDLMVRPYGRVLVLHLTIIFGGFAAMLLGAPLWALVVMIAVKIGMDAGAHLKGHFQLEARAAAREQAAVG
jgi:hypothetical protein